MDERERVLLTLAGVRVFMGVFWLVNLLWRLPTELRQGQLLGPAAHVRGRAHARLTPPVRSFVDHVLIPHMSVVGWIVFLLGLLTGLSLVLGLCTRVGACSGSLQAITITLLLGERPGRVAVRATSCSSCSRACCCCCPCRGGMSVDDALGRDP